MVAGTPSDPTAQRFWLTSYYPVLDRDGDALGVGAVIEEVTDRRRAEQRTELQHPVTRILSAAGRRRRRRHAGAGDRLRGARLGRRLLLAARSGRAAADVGARGCPRRRLPRDDAAHAALAGAPAGTRGRVGRSRVARRTSRPPTFPRASVAEAEGLSSGVGFPILIEGQVAGVLEIFSQARRARDPEILQTLVAIGGQLGQFLRRKRAEDERLQLLQRERQARAEAESAAATLRKLARVSEVALDRIGLNDLLEALLARIAEVLDADTCGDPAARRERRAARPSDRRATRRARARAHDPARRRHGGPRRGVEGAGGDRGPGRGRARQPGAARARDQLARGDPADRGRRGDRRRACRLGGVRAASRTTTRACSS